jgi:hypothetical protein
VFTQKLDGLDDLAVLHVAGGELILMPAHRPHALKAFTRFKMLLTMIRS